MSVNIDNSHIIYSQLHLITKKEIDVSKSKKSFQKESLNSRGDPQARITDLESIRSLLHLSLSSQRESERKLICSIKSVESQISILKPKNIIKIIIDYI